MALPNNTSVILQFLFPNNSFGDWEVYNFNNIITIKNWKVNAPQPTEAEIIAAGNSAAFATWLDKQTDPIKRRREEVKRLLQYSNDPIIIAVRTALKGLGASLREVRQAQGKPVRSDNQFISDLLSGVDAGVGEV